MELVLPQEAVDRWNEVDRWPAVERWPAEERWHAGAREYMLGLGPRLNGG
mgnify:CR=1 FL=1